MEKVIFIIVMIISFVAYLLYDIMVKANANPFVKLKIGDIVAYKDMHYMTVTKAWRDELGYVRFDYYFSDKDGNFLRYSEARGSYTIYNRKVGHVENLSPEYLELRNKLSKLSQEMKNS